MENVKQNQQAMQPEKAPTLVFNIGGSKYTVGIHFNPESKENMADKINRLIRRDILEGAFSAS